MVEGQPVRSTTLKAEPLLTSKQEHLPIEIVNNTLQQTIEKDLNILRNIRDVAFDESK